MIEHLDVPKRLLMGPWCHMNPIDAIPGPRIDHVRELIRWFDRWLRGTENGIDREPPIVLFVRRTTAPEPDLDAFAGEWRYEPAWPPDGGCAALELDTAAATGRAALCCARRRRRHGAHPRHLLPALRARARPAARRDPLAGLRLAVIGRSRDPRQPGRRAARFARPHPVAFAAARLTEVLHDGTSVLVSRGILNLTHRDSHTTPEPLEPGAAY